METIHLHYDGGNEAAREHEFTWASRLREFGDSIRYDVDDNRSNFANLLVVNLITGTASGMITDGYSNRIQELVNSIKIPRRVRVELWLTHRVKQHKFELPSQQAAVLVELKARINPYRLDDASGFHRIMQGKTVVYQIPVPDVDVFRDRTKRSVAIREHLQGLVPPTEIPQVVDAIVVVFD